MLDALVTIDPRYEWRLLDGVVVFRPLAAWDDPENPLAVRADATRLLDEPIGKLAGSVERVLGARESVPGLSGQPVDLAGPGAWHGARSAVALARAHGDLVWAFEELEAEDRKATGLGHRLWWLAGGTGRGIPVK